MRKVIFAAILVISGASIAATFWFDRIGTFSHTNYERIRPGMTVAEVERLLGAPGAEVRERELPGVVNWDVPVDHPKRIKAVVTGERCLRWERGDSYIVVSLRREKVAEKWYWEPSL